MSEVASGVGLLALAAGAGCVSAAQAAPELRNPHVRAGMAVTVEGAEVVIAPGECEVGGRAVKVAATRLPVAPAPIQSVADEPVKLSPDKPQWYQHGTRLRGPSARDVNAFGSMMPGSLEIRVAKDGDLLKVDQDYLVDENGGQVGIGPQSRVTTQDTVFASYRYSLMRMDTLQVSPAGVVSLKAGAPHISAPVPPPADPGCLALAHVWMPYRATEVKPDHVFVIAETAEQAVTASTTGRNPKTMAKLKAGQPVKVVCWGDSVTAGGNASKPEFRYPDVFAAGLKERFPNAPITMENISAGGSSSANWLFPDKNPYRGKSGAESICQFQRIVDAKPDLVTIEFVNDSGLNEQGVETRYTDILNRLAPTGAEVILITPHFTRPNWMGLANLWDPECRPYVRGVRQFTEKHQIALADASARWEHLYKEGLPYLTLLDNTCNHPDDRGHRLFAEELWKCFR